MQTVWPEKKEKWKNGNDALMFVFISSLEYSMLVNIYFGNFYYSVTPNGT